MLDIDFAHPLGWIHMHLHQVRELGHSRGRRKRVSRATATFTAAFRVPHRFLVHAASYRSTYLDGRLSSTRPQKQRPRNASLNPAQSHEVDRACTVIREIGDRIVVPLLRSVEAEEDTAHGGRRLVRFERRFKDARRLKQKVADQLRVVPGRTPTEGVAAVADAIRFTLRYRETGYVAGVRKDVERLKGRGLVLIALRNTWADDQYKGINARWREPTSGLLFEIQFHTQASFWARELTHKAYERIRGDTIDGTEMATLRAFQRRVNAMVPIPAGATDIWT